MLKLLLKNFNLRYELLEYNIDYNNVWNGTIFANGNIYFFK